MMNVVYVYVRRRSVYGTLLRSQAGQPAAYLGKPSNLRAAHQVEADVVSERSDIMYIIYYIISRCFSTTLLGVLYCVCVCVLTMH